MKFCTSILGLGVAERETGAAIVDIEFVRYALMLGHSVQVLVPQGRQACVEHFAGVQLISSGAMTAGLFGRIRRLFNVWRKLWLVYREQPDTVFRVNSFFSSILEVLPILWLARGRLRLFVQFHHKDHNPLRNTLATWVFRQAQVVSCPSNAASTELVELLGYTPIGLVRVYHGVSEKFFIQRMPKKIKNNSDPIRLLFVGHLEIRKNPAFLLRLAQALYGLVFFELRIVGAGPELAGLKSQCSGRPWSNSVLFASDVSDVEKLRFYSEADLFVFPSRQEGFGLVLCESMAAGVPVLAFNTSAMPEIVKPSSGFLVPVDDTTAMVDIITHLAHDRALLNELAAGAIMHARTNFHWQQKLTELCSHLEAKFPPKAPISKSNHTVEGS
jgi:glycosyltransferase involved in cell wall biosynthesis